MLPQDRRTFREAAMSVTLFYSPITCSMAPYITLTEAGADFEVRPVNMRKGQNRTADYLKLNPLHKVPVLVIDGEPLVESVAIQIWIARRYPAAKLLPAAPLQELRAISIMSWCASGFHPYLARINNPARVCDVAGTEEAVKRLAAENLDENFVAAEMMLAGRDWFFDHFTAADAHFFWCWRRATQFDLPLAKFKNGAAHFARMQQRPSVRKLLAFEKEVQAQFAQVA
jgi:glutathione S-transferase